MWCVLGSDWFRSIHAPPGAHHTCVSPSSIQSTQSFVKIFFFSSSSSLHDDGGKRWCWFDSSQRSGSFYTGHRPSVVYISIKNQPLYIFLYIYISAVAYIYIYIYIILSCVIFLDTPIKLSICLGAPLFTLTDFACCLRCARYNSPRCCLLCVYELHYICRSLNARREVALFIQKGEPGNRQVII